MVVNLWHINLPNCKVGWCKAIPYFYWRNNMKYCMQYNRASKYIEDIDEINIQYNVTDAELWRFLDVYPGLRVNIAIQDSKEFLKKQEIEKFIEINEDYNFYVRLNSAFDDNDLELYKKLQENHIAAYFNTYANNWDVFMGLIFLGVSDIFITEQLCFELDEVSREAKKRKISLRMVPNICQSAWPFTPDEKTFFIRPEDVDFYDKYINTIEFFNTSSHMYNEDALYKAYAIEKEWNGFLSEIIYGMKDVIHNNCIEGNFCKVRSNCGRSCLKNGRCRICGSIFNMAKIMYDDGMYLKKVDK